MTPKRKAKTHKLSVHQKQQIARALVDPVVFAEIEAATQQFYLDVEAWSSARETKGVEEGEDGAPVLYPLNRKASRGARPKQEMSRYIAALIPIYERATGERFKRNFKKNAQGVNRERPHPFMWFCLKASGARYVWLSGKPGSKWARYPTTLVTKELAKLHPEAKRGRPTQKPTSK